MKRRSLIFQFTFFTILAFLQTRIFYQNISFQPFLPDFAFIFFIFSAIQIGNKGAYWFGFGCGILMHFFMQPDSILGLYAFIYTLIAFFASQMKGRLIVDPILLPLLYLFVAYLLKLILLTLFSFLPDLIICRPPLVETVINVTLTTIAAPFLYNFMRLIKIVNLNERVKV